MNSSLIRIVLVIVMAILTFSNSYKLSFENGHNVVNMESNKMINGKMVGEPKPTEAIDEFGSLGFQVVNGEGKGKGREAIKQLRNRIPVANRHSSMEIKPSEPIDQIFKKISHINENGQIDDVKKSLNQNQNQNQAGNTVQNLNELKNSGSFDIFITNVNENSNVNNGTSSKLY